MDKQEIIEKLRFEDYTDLCRQACDLRNFTVGRKVFLRGIIEFSNYCMRNCLYCGLRKDNQQLIRYRMEPDKIVALAEKIIGQGVRTLVLQSGDDFYYTAKTICGIVSRIKKIPADVAVTLSLGERPLDEYKAFFDSGADRYLLKLEAASPDLYKKLHPGQTQRQRKTCLEQLKKIGYQVGTGGMIGVPFQTIENIAEDILYTKEIEADMAGFGPFIPHHDTPLHADPAGSAKLTIKVLALVRLISPDILLPVTTALETVEPGQGLDMGLKAGCNVIMPDFTPGELSTHYTIYDNKARITLEKATAAIKKAGLKVDWGRGDSFKKK